MNPDQAEAPDQVWRQVPRNAVVIDGEVIPINVGLKDCSLVLFFGSKWGFALQRMDSEAPAPPPPSRRFGKYSFEQ
jgi:hypothetical protein